LPHTIPKEEQERNKNTARHRLHTLLGGNSMVSINFANFFPAVDKRNIANSSERKTMIEGVKLMAIMDGMYRQDASFKKDVDEFDRTNGACSKAWSSAHVIKLPSDDAAVSSPHPMPSTPCVPGGLSRGAGGVTRVAPSSTPSRPKPTPTSQPQIIDQEEEEEEEEEQPSKKRTVDRTNANLAQKQAIESAPSNVFHFWDSMASGQIHDALKFPQNGLVVGAAKELRKSNKAFSMIHKPGQDSLRSATRHYPIAATQAIEKALATNDINDFSKKELKKIIDVLIAGSYSSCWVRSKNKLLRWPNALKPVKARKAMKAKEIEEAEEAEETEQPNDAEPMSHVQEIDDDADGHSVSPESLFGDSDGVEDEDDEEEHSVDIPGICSSASTPKSVGGAGYRIPKRKPENDAQPFVKRKAAAVAQNKARRIQQDEELGSDVDNN
jgi:hypothetical protein